MLVTAAAWGWVVPAEPSVLGQFGLVTGPSSAHSSVASLLVRPSVLVVWNRSVGNDPAIPMDPTGDDPEPSTHAVASNARSVGSTFRAEGPPAVAPAGGSRPVEYTMHLLGDRG